MDYEGTIVAFETNIPGSVHDANVALHRYHFPRILGKKRYALGGPGYAGVPYIIKAIN